MTKEQEQLITDNIKLVYYIAHKYTQYAEEFDDLSGYGMLALCRAAVTFDPSKGNTFSTYASMCITNGINMYLRTLRKVLSTASLEAPIFTDKEGNEMALQDLVEYEEEGFARLEQMLVLESVKQAITELKPVERKCIQFYYGLNGETLKQHQIADRLSLSQSYIARVIKQAHKKLKVIIERNERYGEVKY